MSKLQHAATVVVLNSKIVAAKPLPAGALLYDQEVIDKLQAELLLYKNALWKACGDDEDVVNATLESER